MSRIAWKYESGLQTVLMVALARYMHDSNSCQIHILGHSSREVYIPIHDFPFNIAAQFFLKAFLRIAWLLLDLGQLFDACIGLLIFLRLIKATSLFRPFWPSLSWRLFTFTLRTRGYSTLFFFTIKHQMSWNGITNSCCILIDYNWNTFFSHNTVP